MELILSVARWAAAVFLGIACVLTPMEIGKLHGGNDLSTFGRRFERCVMWLLFPLFGLLSLMLAFQWWFLGWYALGILGLGLATMILYRLTLHKVSTSFDALGAYLLRHESRLSEAEQLAKENYNVTERLFHRSATEDEKAFLFWEALESLVGEAPPRVPSTKLWPPELLARLKGESGPQQSQ